MFQSKGNEEMNIYEIKKQAQKELDEEQFRHAVERYKDKLRKSRSLWDKIIPFKIIIVRKEKL